MSFSESHVQFVQVNGVIRFNWLSRSRERNANLILVFPFFSLLVPVSASWTGEGAGGGEAVGRLFVARACGLSI